MAEATLSGGGLAAMSEDWAAMFLQIQNEGNKQIGILIGKVDGINDRLDRLNGSVSTHEQRIGEIEQVGLDELKKNVGTLQDASLTSAGAAKVKKTIWSYTWTIIQWFFVPAAGIVVGWLLIRLASQIIGKAG